MSQADNLRIRCPDCESELVVDRRTGEIVHHQKAKRSGEGGKSLETLFRDQEKGRSRAEELFEREKASLEDRDRLMEEKFRQALEKVDKSDNQRPARPFDLD